jgi:voltage-gated potassium channel
MPTAMTHAGAVLAQAAAAGVLVTLSLAIQCGGMTALIRWGLVHFTRDARPLGPFRAATLIVRVTTLMIGLHLTQILAWAAFYEWNCFGAWGKSFYFSITSYSTVGYGDIVLPERCQSLGPIEAMTGVLMCGLSVSLLFAIVTRLVDREIRLVPELAEVRTRLSDTVR